jgi:hypothetical protein
MSTPPPRSVDDVLQLDGCRYNRHLGDLHDVGCKRTIAISFVAGPLRLLDAESLSLSRAITPYPRSAASFSLALSWLLIPTRWSLDCRQ